ncbi:MAG: hypothetical protein LBQ20_03240 [Rhodanobacter sp.]|nr:hypothetical protein [Rhodanobacter sp.]
MAQRNRSLNLKSAKSRQALSVTHPNAAGIDIGSASHYVAVPADRVLRAIVAGERDSLRLAAGK